VFPSENGPKKFLREGYPREVFNKIFTQKNDGEKGYCNKNLEHENINFLK